MQSLCIYLAPYELVKVSKLIIAYRTSQMDNWSTTASYQDSIFLSADAKDKSTILVASSDNCGL